MNLEFNNLEELLEYLKTIETDIMIIGGAQIYREFLPYTDIMLLTEITEDKSLIEADKYFPEFNRDEWSSEILGEYAYEEIKYKRLRYQRK